MFLVAVPDADPTPNTLYSRQQRKEVHSIHSSSEQGPPDLICLYDLGGISGLIGGERDLSCEALIGTQTSVLSAGC